MKKVKFSIIGYALILVLAVVLLCLMCLNNDQAIMSMALRVTFQGEYKIADGEWRPIVKGEKIPSTEGDVTIKGYFQAETTDGEVIGKVQQGLSIALYFNHIGGQIYMNGELCHDFDSENSLHKENSCGEHWLSIDCPASETDTLEIVLKNPHKYGNDNAVNEFLDSMYMYSGKTFEDMMIEKGTAGRTVGFVIIVISLILIGVAVFSTLLNIPQSTILWLFGLLAFFAGGFFVISSPNIILWNDSPVFNTTAKQLCIIMYPLFMFALVSKCLSDKLRKAGNVIAALSAITSCVVLVVAVSGKKLIYDLTFYWLAVMFPLALSLSVCCILSYRKASKSKIIVLTVCLLALMALDADILAVVCGWWQNALISKAIFILFFAAALVLSFKVIPTSVRAGIHEKELKLELQQSKIALLLSQIQPHFLNNSLSAICDLCCRDPQKARDALVDFSVYLRGNMDTLSSNEPIPFSMELSHIEAYLKLEKLRFGDKLNVIYDIEADDFFIPPLSVQPLVENAVQHGICCLENSGTVTIRTYKKENVITIIVIDDGTGFDVNDSMTDQSDHSHLGLQNVKKRIEQMPKGKLIVDSAPDKGTTVTIQFNV